MAIALQMQAGVLVSAGHILDRRDSSMLKHGHRQRHSFNKTRQNEDGPRVMKEEFLLSSN
ncbi:hypothetical protein [Herbaspirillum sp. RV1423]|uniref:hypothetical protein n=1 Tax=Herbaspirillum sp. RV1423 TaxID=1443993 RepID=UPI0012DD3216|nr:hypothetical protein [Herbaspirillum sp. RV1423]